MESRQSVPKETVVAGEFMRGKRDLNRRSECLALGMDFIEKEDIFIKGTTAITLYSV